MPRNRNPHPAPPTITESVLLASLGTFTAALSIVVALDGGLGPRNTTPTFLVLALLLVLVMWTVQFAARLRRAARPQCTRMNKRGA